MFRGGNQFQGASPQQLIPGFEPVHLHCSLVCFGDGTVQINNYYAIGNRLKHLVQLFFCPLTLGDILIYPDKPLEITGTIKMGGAGNLKHERCAIFMEMGNFKPGEGLLLGVKFLKAFKPFRCFFFWRKVERFHFTHYFIHLIAQDIFNLGADKGICSLFIRLPYHIAGRFYQVFKFLLCLLALGDIDPVHEEMN